jgi:hypothetical protein
LDKKEKDPSDKKENQAELPFCVGLEVRVLSLFPSTFKIKCVSTLISGIIWLWNSCRKIPVGMTHYLVYSFLYFFGTRQDSTFVNSTSYFMYEGWQSYVVF